MAPHIQYEAVNGNADVQDEDAVQSDDGASSPMREREEVSRQGHSSSRSSVSEVDFSRDAPAKVEIPSDFRALKLLENSPYAKLTPEWRDGVQWCFWGSAVVLVVNIGFMIAALGVSASKDRSLSFGSVMLYQGSCTTTRNIKIGLHLLVNVLSVAMTATSSYCCAILMAPSRADIDKAHSQGNWLSVGISSWRNFRNLRRTSQALWTILLLTSLIIQMIYNSVVYSSLNSNSYTAILAPTDFVQANSSMSTASYEYQSCWPEDIMNVTNLRTSILNGSYEHLSKNECIEKYATNFVSDRRNVVLVTQSPMTGDGVSFSGYGYAGGIAAANPANTNPDDYDSWFKSVLPLETIDPLGYEWMCYMKGWSDSGTSCSSASLEQESEWNVASRDWARQTTTLIPGTGQELSRQALTTQNISEWETWLMEFKNISWTRAEVGNFLTEVQANPLPEQMLAYLKNVSWSTSGVNVSSYCPSSGNLYQYDLSDNELPQYPVDYCLSQKVGEECGVFYHLPIAIVVIICSIIKLGCMWFLLRMNRQDLIITLGDAISAFLQQPDQATKYWCTLSAKTVSKSDEFSGKKESDLSSGDESCPNEPHPDLLPLVKTKWTKASNVKIWCLTWLMLVLYIVMSLLLPEAAVENTSTHATQSLTPSTAIWQIKGWGDVQSTALLSKFASSFTGMVLLSNTPQLAVSILYFCLNDTMTRYLFAAGYSDYARNRRPLRVSYPRGEQQSTLYLTIPYQYAIPLLAAVTLVHWFVSEGLFYVQILPYDLSGNPIFSARLITCGVSTIPLEMALFLMIIVCVVVCLLGCKSLKPSRMPLAFGCSLAISAACHPPSYDLDAAFKPVQWGAVEDEPGQLYSHCSFTSKEAKEPETGVQYA